ncbi:cytochrome C assembly family protein [Aquibacillus saliphilus]|uniref:cytochrome C assembly family protein n=1 Tax=Aquibacillus saliphilus TaxID=1909422 RepID=UPI001CF0357E|nr:cytochrome c biogenesis protein CcsA [Aquibacillus saliphilus]
MLELKWLYELILIIYAASVMGYFIDFVQHNRRANNIAFWLLSLVWMLQTFFLLYQIFAEMNFPVVNVYDGLYFYAWILVTFSLLINRFFKIDFLVFFTNLFGFLIMVLHITAKADNKGLEGVQLVSEILITHITLALISYGLFTVSFVFSLMYLLQHRLLKKKKGYKWLKRLGDLNRLDSLSFMLITIATPALLLSVILGVVWAYTSGAEFYWYDIKTVGSFVVLVVYFIYLFLRIVKNYQGRSISLYNTAAFLFLLVNFLLFGTLSSFHF